MVGVGADSSKVLAMKPDSRVKWLARAVQQAHPQANVASVEAHAEIDALESRKSGRSLGAQDDL